MFEKILDKAGDLDTHEIKKDILKKRNMLDEFFEFADNRAEQLESASLFTSLFYFYLRKKGVY